MYFDDKYFKTEEIDGFVVDSMMKRAWAAEMEIMQEIMMLILIRQVIHLTSLQLSQKIA